eukprot:g5392.t1
MSATTAWAALYRLFDGGTATSAGADAFARQLPSNVRTAATRVRVKMMGEELRNATVRSASHARALLASGHSLVVQQAHLLPAIGAPLLPLLRDLHTAGFRDVGVNAYLGAPNSSALRPHSDTTDIYILALGGGTKAWRLCVPTANDADRADIDASAAAGLPFTDGDLAHLADMRRQRPGGCANYDDAEFAAMRRCETIELSGGDTLHIPKGVVHHVVVLAGGEAGAPSGGALHLTLGTDRVQSSWAAVLERMLAQATPVWPAGDIQEQRPEPQRLHPLDDVREREEREDWRSPLGMDANTNTTVSIFGHFDAAVTVAIDFKRIRDGNAGAPVPLTGTTQLRRGGAELRITLPRVPKWANSVNITIKGFNFGVAPAISAVKPCDVTDWRAMAIACGDAVAN